MAILGKIRQKSFFLILIIGLALFAFIISGVFGNGAGDTGPSDPIGIVNDEEIKIENFRFLVDQTERQYGYSTIQAVNAVWNQYVQSTLFEAELNTLGIDAGKEQIEQVVSSTESIISDARFINEAGFFDFGLFADFILQMRDQNPEGYEQWKSQEAGIISSARESIYFDLIKSSTGITNKEAQVLFHLENDNLDLNYVQIPFSSINDTLVSVSDSEIKAYIKDNAASYETKASRGLDYVAFLETPTEEDQAIIRNYLTSLIDDRIEYNDVSKLTDTIQGFKSTTFVQEFVDKYSEKGFDSLYLPKGRLPREFGDILFDLEKGAVFGPYKNIDSYQISRLLDRKKNGSIRASNIVVAYEGATGASADITRTKEEARRLSNNYLRQSRRDPSQVEILALKFSDDQTKTSGGELGFFQEGAIPQEFFDYANKARIGSVGLVETDYGFHVVKVTDKQDLVLLATVSQKIVPSEKTSNEIFQAATQFEMGTAKQDFTALASAENYNLRTVNSIDALDENLPGLPNQRSIVQWAFGEDASIGDVKRFSLSYGGYAIVKLTSKKDKGLADVEEVRAEVSQIIRNEKKAAMLLVKANKANTSLEDLAAANKVEVVSALSVNQKSATLVGAGNEPYVVGAAFAMEANETSDLIVGNKGVYMIQVTAKNIVDDLEDYTSFANTLAQQERQKVARLVMDALESSATITDNRSLYY
jgi:peptidyl-prolyl cis-trans isomerase D